MKPPSEITTRINITDDNGNRLGDGTIAIPITYGKPERHGNIIHVPIIVSNKRKPADGERAFDRGWGNA